MGAPDLHFCSAQEAAAAGTFHPHLRPTATAAGKLPSLTDSLLFQAGSPPPVSGILSFVSGTTLFSHLSCRIPNFVSPT